MLVPILESDVTLRIHERANVAAWWTTKRANERRKAAEGPVARCLVSGLVDAVARTHPGLKGPPFPGTGAMLVSYNKSAFASQGLEQGDNAPVSEAAAQKYTSALNHLLEKDANKRRRSAIDLDDESVIVFWTKEESDAGPFVLDILAPPIRGDDAAEHVRAVWRGKKDASFTATPFYGVTLGAAKARVIVRDWFETTAARVKENIDAWFADLHLGDEEVQPVPLYELLRVLQATPDASGDKRGLSVSLASQVFRAAVQGAPLPRSLLSAALMRMRVPPHKRENAATVLRLRVGIIKAVLVRLDRTNRKEIPVALDEENTDRAYLLGRLFAAIEQLQSAAAGRGTDLNATVRDRYYGSASTTPAAVFGRLLALSMHHAAKTKNDGLGIVAEKAKAAIMAKVSPEGFPRTLNLEEQGLFAIGYYHQRSAFFKPRTKGESHGQEEV